MEIDLNDLRSRTTAELSELAERFHIEKASSLTRQELIFGILSNPSSRTAISRGSGILEILPDGFGFLRAPESFYLAGPDDIYVSPSQIRKFNLRTGDTVKGQVRSPKENERYFALIKVEHVNGRDPEQSARPLLFDHLAAVHPSSPLSLEFQAQELSTRAIDLLAPLGKGQRVLVYSPPRSGHRELLLAIGQGIRQNHPDCHLLILLLHQRPEDITDFQRAFSSARLQGGGDRAEIVATAFDEPAARHVQVADLIIERARRLAEYGQNVVVILDSLTALARACNESSTNTVLRSLPGGLDPAAMQKPRRMMASARAIHEGGSITLIASLLTETDSHADQTIQELFKGTASNELHLRAGSLLGCTIPDPSRSVSTNESRFLDPSHLALLRAFRAELPGEPEQAAWSLLEILQARRTNAGVLDKSLGTGE